jgi:hypothetical protein
MANLAVTDDLYMRTPGIVDPADQEILRPGLRVVSSLELLEVLRKMPESERPPEPVPGFFELTPDGLREMQRAAGRTSSVFSVYAMKTMTDSRAQEVRDLRCERRHSWRALAAECHRRWEGPWEPPSNQLMGMALCEQAATMLGEDAHILPWNDL